MRLQRAHISRLYREPLVHFILIAGLIFGSYGIVSSFSNRKDTRISVTIEQVERMAIQWENTWGRRPSDAELQGLVRDYVRAEIYYREGVKLGLDLDDAIIRNRVRQRMEQFSGIGMIDPSPTAVEIENYYVEHPEKYRSPTRMTISHIYLADADSDQIAQSIELLEQGVDPEEISDPIPVPLTLNQAASEDIAGLLGTAFVDAVSELKPREWTGPVSSGFGQHLVMVSVIEPATIAPLRDVRHLVVVDWTRDARQKAIEENYQSLSRKYTIELERP